jgi:uncharacterized membrane protein YeaQ/YmgE (transglycosylase-associated protein family)
VGVRHIHHLQGAIWQATLYNEDMLRADLVYSAPHTFERKRKIKMNLLIYLIFGAIVGYVASRIMRTNSQQGLLLDILVGILGAFLAGYFISPLVGVGTINDAITLPTLLVTLLGSVILLWIYKQVRR